VGGALSDKLTNNNNNNNNNTVDIKIDLIKPLNSRSHSKARYFEIRNMKHL